MQVFNTLFSTLKVFNTLFSTFVLVVSFSLLMQDLTYLSHKVSWFLCLNLAVNLQSASLLFFSSISAFS
ncbi:N-terminal [Zea mays]|uniref:N-terminal n=1 Tax=Zea mays TaxID=4577 RepID=A0A1D6ET76_MAIZE|nr:N-terminal [Zea mays]